ncbi:hypothetical protein PspLS_05593 [Pyricularia sp. CBS 133598]|nr:hypothetical protein PspLS_05593 [Pyricularia sp. CBS 133598]
MNGATAAESAPGARGTALPWACAPTQDHGSAAPPNFTADTRACVYPVLLDTVHEDVPVSPLASSSPVMYQSQPSPSQTEPAALSRATTVAHPLQQYTSMRDATTSAKAKKVLHNIASEETIQVEADGDYSQDSRASRDRKWLANWWQEIMSSIISVICLGAIIIVLKKFENLSITKWALPISINSMIAIFTAIMKACLIFPVAESLIPRINVYTGGKARTLPGQMWIPEVVSTDGNLRDTMQAAIYLGLVRPPANSSVATETFCPTGNCTFKADDRSCFQNFIDVSFMS